MKLHELKQARNTVAANMRKMHEEMGDKEWSDEQRSKWKSMKSELDGLDEKIDREEELRAADQKFVEENADEHKKKAKDDAGDQRSVAFNAFLRSGAAEMDPELRSVLREMRAQGTTPADKGGYTVPTEFDGRVRDKLKAFGGVANIAQQLTTSDGRDIDWATSDGTAEEGELVGENSAATEKDVDFGADTLGAKKISSKIIRVSEELLADSGINIEEFLAGRIATRIGRTRAKLLINGTGAGTPKQPKGLAAGVTKTVSTAAATKVTWKEMNALKHAVDPAYRNETCSWLFNDNTLSLVEEMEDTNGKPLWLPGIDGSEPSTFRGYKYQVDQAVDDIAAGKKFIYFGDFSRFVVRSVSGMMLKRLVERYAEFGQVGFLSFMRFDCILEDNDAIKALVGKSS